MTDDSPFTSMDEATGERATEGAPDAGTRGDSNPVMVGSSQVDPFEIARSTTLREIHSFTVGCGMTLLSTLATAGALVSFELLGAAIALWSTTAMLVLVAAGARAAPTNLRYIPKEPHYFIAGGGIGGLVGLALIVPIGLVFIGANALEMVV